MSRVFAVLGQLLIEVFGKYFDKYFCNQVICFDKLLRKNG